MLRGGLWRDWDFVRLWVGQTVAIVGSAVTLLALPTAAILNLHAGPLQVGLLAACQRLPFLFLTLFAGALLDRTRRRPVMIACDIARALVLLAIPVTAATSALSMPLLYIAALLLGIFTVFFDIGVLAFLPGLIGRERLSEGYTKLDSSMAIANLVGPGLGGLLIQALGAPLAFLANAASYLVSAGTLLLIRRPEPDLTNPDGAARPRIREDVAEGLRWVFGHALLRSELLSITSGIFGLVMVQPLILIFAYDTLHFSPGLMGAIFAVEGTSGLLGLWAASAVTRFLGVGRTMWMTQLVSGLALLFLPAAKLGLPVLILTGSLVVSGFAVTIQDLNQVTLRQTLTPDRFQGRMNATFRLFYWGTMPIATLIGGVLGDRLGAGPAITIGGVFCLIATLAIGLTALGKLPQKSVASVS